MQCVAAYCEGEVVHEIIVIQLFSRSHFLSSLIDGSLFIADWDECKFAIKMQIDSL